MRSIGKFSSGVDLEIKLSLLRASNINFVQKKNLGNFIGISVGEIGEEEIFVDEKKYEEAKKIISENF